MKVCTACGRLRREALFYRRAASPDGLMPVCKPCADASNESVYSRTPAYKRRSEANRKAALVLVTELLDAEHMLKVRTLIEFGAPRNCVVAAVPAGSPVRTWLNTRGAW